MLKILLVCVTFFPFALSAQTYTSWFTGDTADFQINPYPGLVLAGGGGDNDDAMQWMLQRARGGDVVVIRASGSDGYNNYFYSQLGVNVNSVETLLLNSSAAANHPYVDRRIREAEVVFIAGGDQYNYYQYWKDGPVEDALNYLINVKRATVGGTSAGMAILGQVYYTPPGGSADSAEALGNPYHPDVNIIGRDDFLLHSSMANTITDTHFDDRNRAGRTVAFMARMETDWGIDAFAIACNEWTAVCVDTTGRAYVFGETPTYPEYAYFMQSNCAPPSSVPENCTNGNPLDWNRNQEALKVYKVPGTVSGTNWFDINDWTSGSGGTWQDWWVDNGVLNRSVPVNPPCNPVAVEEAKEIRVRVYPQPAIDLVFFDFGGISKSGTLRLLDHQGRMVVERRFSDLEGLELGIGALSSGLYFYRLGELSGSFWKR